ncbi:hypothetical protein HPP92_004078 [Vanilla planifolia]|uniref:EF-hand domain-containing protein n=1 Tax=Vanilla planifolia TaxID=51239 RepID=A0A835VHT5_VANPL|nr:hypothetical protein HPP92_004078 [Vanilla planifolia]
MMLLSINQQQTTTSSYRKVSECNLSSLPCFSSESIPFIIFLLSHLEATMAFKHVRAANGGLTVEEFKEWLKSFDVDGDGRIGRDELRRAIRSIGGGSAGGRVSGESAKPTQTPTVSSTIPR